MRICRAIVTPTPSIRPREYLWLTETKTYSLQPFDKLTRRVPCGQGTPSPKIRFKDFRGGYIVLCGVHASIHEQHIQESGEIVATFKDSQVEDFGITAIVA